MKKKTQISSREYDDATQLLGSRLYHVVSTYVLPQFFSMILFFYFIIFYFILSLLLTPPLFPLLLSHPSPSPPPLPSLLFFLVLPSTPPLTPPLLPSPPLPSPLPSSPPLTSPLPLSSHPLPLLPPSPYQEENDPNFKGHLWSDLLSWYLQEFEYELTSAEIFDAKRKTVNQVISIISCFSIVYFILFYFLFLISSYVEFLL